MAQSERDSIPNIPRERVLVAWSDGGRERFIIGKSDTRTGYAVTVQHELGMEQEVGFKNVRHQEATKPYILDILATHDWESVHANAIDLRRYVGKSSSQ